MITERMRQRWAAALPVVLKVKLSSGNTLTFKVHSETYWNTLWDKYQKGATVKDDWTGKEATVISIRQK